MVFHECLSVHVPIYLNGNLTVHLCIFLFVESTSHTYFIWCVVCTNDDVMFIVFKHLSLKITKAVLLGLTDHSSK